MTVDFQIPQNRLLPLLTATLSDADGVLNLAGTTVKFQMRLPGSGNVLKVDADAEVESAEDGTVSYTWTADDTDTEGLYVGTFEVTTSGKPFQAPEPMLIIEVTRGTG